MKGVILLLLLTLSSSFSFTTPTKSVFLSNKSFSILKTSTTALFSSDKGLKDDQVGDDAAYFSFEEQNLKDWVKFLAATSFLLASVAWVWFLPSGPHGGDRLLESVQSSIGTTDPAWTVAALLTVFATFHSGLAGLRTFAESIIGARAWRVLFAVVSLPIALSCVVYFLNHAHDGIQLWDVTGIPGIHVFVWLCSFVSFLFLYPSSFNLLEVAAIEKPQLHLWETGITRITRHPQAVGQFLWCFAHTLWLGSTTAVAASSILLLHHTFSIWHGDRRLRERHGNDFDVISRKTSVFPFQAIFEGRQELPSDYYKEFLRWPYLIVVGGTIAAYYSHPFMQTGAASFHW